MNFIIGLIVIAIFVFLIGALATLCESVGLNGCMTTIVVITVPLIGLCTLVNISNNSDNSTKTTPTPISTETQTISEACRKIPRFGDDACGSCKTCQYLRKNDCPGQNSISCESTFKQCNGLIASSSCR
jgi:hypothetical protein